MAYVTGVVLIVLCALAIMQAFRGDHGQQDQGAAPRTKIAETKIDRG
jgi:hypothetical protein